VAWRLVRCQPARFRIGCRRSAEKIASPTCGRLIVPPQWCAWLRKGLIGYTGQVRTDPTVPYARRQPACRLCLSCGSCARSAVVDQRVYQGCAAARGRRCQPPAAREDGLRCMRRSKWERHPRPCLWIPHRSAKRSFEAAWSRGFWRAAGAALGGRAPGNP
jgi:hypothetical protein